MAAGYASPFMHRLCYDHSGMAGGTRVTQWPVRCRVLLVIRILSWLNSLYYIFSLLSHLPHHCKALNSLICADVPSRNYSLTHPIECISLGPVQLTAELDTIK